MDPIALDLGFAQIRWYGIMMALSMLFGAWISAWILNRNNRDGSVIWDLLPLLIISGIVGARLVYVITSPGQFFGAGANFWDIFAVWKGGISFHGGIIAGLIATWLYLRNKELTFLEVMDSFAPGVSLGVVLVRIGNFMNGDIAGYRWEGPWAMNFPYDMYHNYGVDPVASSEVILRHPTELYGLLVGVFCLLVTIVLSNETWRTRRYPHGTVMFGFVITYSLVRSIIEDPFRVVPLLPKGDPLVDPAVHGWGALTYSQVASIILILIGIWGLSQLRRWNASVAGKHGAESRQVKRAKDRQSGKKVH